ncbi:MAG: symmetrical bis(5'-nucleosyl)-tetraphosphatase, partial [Thioalkalispiraceae bacterium]
ITVLGNHDLHLLAVYTGVKKTKSKDLKAILNAEDRDELITWLRSRPVLHHDEQLGYTMVHAGLAPQWDLSLAKRCARELETVLSGDLCFEFLQNMYGNEPRKWKEELEGWNRLRFICNCFTRVRFCTKNSGKLALEEKGPPMKRTDNLVPWFEVEGRQNQGLNILFGHWSTLGAYHSDGLHCLDTGCVWGGRLTALRLDLTPPTYMAINCPGAQNALDFLGETNSEHEDSDDEDKKHYDSRLSKILKKLFPQ